MPFAATFIHNLDPILIDIPGTPLALRWYGLAYVGGFVLGYMLLNWLSGKKLFCIEQEKLGDFVTLVCIFGVLLGGRLGEFFFYWLPEHGLNGFLADPTWVFRVWEGGMASHGGIICVLLTVIWYAWRHKISAVQMIDGVAIASPIGLFFGRVANFINGELYGRITSAANPLSMKFPQEIFELPPQQQIQAMVAVEHAAGQSMNSLALPGESFFDTLSRICRENETAREALGQFLNPRYPSQLFEALGEGLLIFAILLSIRLLWKQAPAGIFAALFAFIYAAARITCECFKQPDAAVWHGITQGQALSLLIAALGVPFLIIALRNLRKQKNL
jgi:phosphatidylglycerol:prolipoprotein diacylglycerol transferase